MEFSILAFVYLIMIGLIVGWLYGVLTKNRGMKPARSMSVSTVGAVGGGLIFAVFNLAAVLAMSVMSSVLILFVTHIMSKA